MIPTSSCKGPRMLSWAGAGMPVSGFVCRNVWVGMQWECLLLQAELYPKLDEFSSGFLSVTAAWQANRTSPTCVCVCDVAYMCVDEAAVFFMNVICACPVSLPLTGRRAVCVGFWRRKGRAIWSWCRRNTPWWLARILVTSASIMTSCSTAPSTDCWAPARGSCQSL